jgi:uncharacterized membrane protein YozB (DUF420 family)
VDSRGCSRKGSGEKEKSVFCCDGDRSRGHGFSGIRAVLLSSKHFQPKQKSVDSFAHPWLSPQLFDIIVFATLVSWAIYWRRSSDWHKRLMLSATILLLGAAVVRIVAFNGIHDPRYFILAEYCSAFVFFVSCFAYDWMTRHKLHPANIVGLALILLDLSLQPIVLSWGPWSDFANSIQRLVA